MGYDKVKINEIERILKGIYPEANLSPFATALYISAFYERRDLSDIFCTVSEYEEELGFSDSRGWEVFDRIAEILDNCPDTARRLYKSFMCEYDNFTTFLKLMLENSQFISPEEQAAAVEKAKKLFDKSLIEAYGF